MFGVRFSFVATRSGLTRVRHYNNGDLIVRRDALAFAKKFGRAIDEPFYYRTVDFNLLHNETAIVVQVPFNLHERIALKLAKYESINRQSFKVSTDSADQNGSSTFSKLTLLEKLNILANSSLHVITTQAIVASEGSFRAAAGVVGVFHDFPTFLRRFFNVTNTRYSNEESNNFDQTSSSQSIGQKPASCYASSDSAQLPPECSDDNFSNRRVPSEPLKCGEIDSIDCLLIDNNGFIVASEQLEYIGRHLRVYEEAILSHLVQVGVFRQVNIKDNQAICEKSVLDSARDSASSQASAGASSFTLKSVFPMPGLFVKNICASLWHIATSFLTIILTLIQASKPTQAINLYQQQQQQQQQIAQLQLQIPSRTLLRPCVRTHTLYEMPPLPTITSQLVNKSDKRANLRSGHHKFINKCNCNAWFVYESVPKTNLLMLILGLSDFDCTRCAMSQQQQQDQSNQQPNDDIQTQTVDDTDTSTVCSKLEFESHLYKHNKQQDTCYSHHKDESQIHICGAAFANLTNIPKTLICICLLLSMLISRFRLSLNI